MFVGAKVLGVVLKRLLDGTNHLAHVPVVIFVVIDLNIDVVPCGALDFVASRNERIKIQRGVIDLVVVVNPPVLFAWRFLKRTGCDGDLVVGCADECLNV